MIDSIIQLSVIVPCYNVEGYLERCLDSLVRQNIDADAYEVLLIDDGSTDGTGVICDRYAAQYPQVQAIHQANAGQGAARNAGLDLAQGKYIFFVDSDDFVAENCFQQLLKLADSEKLDVLAFHHQKVEEYEITDVGSIKVKEEVNVMGGVEFLSANGWAANVWWYIVRRSFVEEKCLRFPVGHMLEDISFTLEMFLSARRVAKVNAVCYYYVQHSQSIMHNTDSEHKRKFVSDCLYCYHLMADVIAKYRSEMGDRLYTRLATRRDVHLYIGLGEAFKLGEVKSFYQKLKSDGLLPLGKIDQSEFAGLQWEAARLLFNCPALTCALSKLYSVFRH